MFWPELPISECLENWILQCLPVIVIVFTFYFITQSLQMDFESGIDFFFSFFFKFVSFIVSFCFFCAFFHQNLEVCAFDKYHFASVSQVLGKRWNLSSRRYGFDEMNLFVEHFRLNLMIFCTGRVKFKPDG